MNELPYDFDLHYDVKGMEDIEAIAAGRPYRSDVTPADLAELFHDLGMEVPDCLKPHDTRADLNTKHIYITPIGCFAETHKPALQQLIRKVLDNGIPTGSREWGLAHSYSDFDFVVKWEDVEDFFNEREMEVYAASMQLPTWGVKLYECDGQWCDSSPHIAEEERLTSMQCQRVVNVLITRTEAEYFGWEEATQVMGTAIQVGSFKYHMKSKANRVKMFETLRSIYGIGDKRCSPSGQ